MTITSLWHRTMAIGFYLLWVTVWHISVITKSQPHVHRALPSPLRCLRHPRPTITHSWWSLGWEQVMLSFHWSWTTSIVGMIVKWWDIGTISNDWWSHNSIQSCNVDALLERLHRRLHCFSQAWRCCETKVNSNLKIIVDMKIFMVICVDLWLGVPDEHYLCVFCFKHGKNMMMMCFLNLITDRSATGLARHFSGSTCSSTAAGE